MGKKKRKTTPAAVPGAVEAQPQDWEKAVSAAYLRLTGSTQKEAAKAAGCGERTLREWETRPWWPRAEAEAHQRWLRGLDNLVRNKLGQALKDPKEYAATARWYADRRIPELRPPTVRAELGGAGGGPIQLNVEDARARLTELLNRQKAQEQPPAPAAEVPALPVPSDGVPRTQP